MVTLYTGHVYEGVCFLDDLNLLTNNCAAHIFQKALFMILLKVKRTLMNLGSPMVGTKVLLALTLEPKKTKLLLTTFVGTPYGLRITHFTAVTTMNEGVCLKFSDAWCGDSYALSGDYGGSCACCDAFRPHS
jgi:hypothetical protein